MLTDLEKYDRVNSAESIEELEEAIKLIDNGTGWIQGRSNTFTTEHQVAAVGPVVRGSIDAANLTRMFGIRQQALYLKHYHN